MDIDRRGFLRIAGTAYLTASLPFPAAAIVGQGDRTSVAFPQGVASCDPEPDTVMLWTRAVPAAAKAAAKTPVPLPIPLIVQLSRSEHFEKVLVEEAVSASIDNDYTVRAVIDGLEPATRYYYRFVAPDGGTSRVGRTLTAPADDSTAAVQLAFASCQNYEEGHYGAWARMVSDDRARPADRQIQAVVHLGDFIYESFPQDGRDSVRRMPPFPDGASSDKWNWAITLDDYRHLYKTCLTDPHLQEARARWPFVCTWDDHEFSNDAFGHFSTYTNPPKPELQRLRNAHRAWFEFMPARVPARRDLQIYRRIRWGRQMDLVVTDLRSYRSEHAVPDGLAKRLGLPLNPVELVDILDSGRDYNGGKPPATLPYGDRTTPNHARDRAPGTMMGAEQKAWFKRTLAQSGANWKVWGNSLPMLPLRLDLSSLPGYDLQDSVLSKDAWAGFPGEARELLNWLDQQGISGLVSLSGDHHMHSAATLVLDPNDEDSRSVAADFNVAGISSTPHLDSVKDTADEDNPGFRQLVVSEKGGRQMDTWNMSLLDGVLASLAYDKLGLKWLARWLGPNKANPGLAYADSNANGFGLARFEDSHCEVELVTTARPQEDTGAQGSEVVRRSRFRLPRWKPGQPARLEGPSIEGTPPFPF